MIRLSTIMTLTLSLLFFYSCSQNIENPPRSKFFEFLNEYQTDSLQLLLADNFEIIRTFTNNKTDRKKVFEYYIPVSKNFNSQYKILKSKITEQSEEYLIEDQSDYLRLLNIDYPTWEITLKKNSKKQIESAVFDTTKTFQKYLLQSNTKGKAFESWLKLKYPAENILDIYTVNGLMQKRLKEYLEK